MKRIMTKWMMIFAMMTLVFSMSFYLQADVHAEENMQMESVQQVKLSQTQIRLKVGQKKQLKLKHVSSGVTWKSKNSEVAKVGAKGVVRAKKSGKTTIIAKFAGKKYKCKVTVISNTSTSRSSASTGGRSSDSSSSSEPSRSGTVYWTPGGSVYHYSSNCPTLSRSRTIYRGTISQSGKSRGCKVCG